MDVAQTWRLGAPRRASSATGRPHRERDGSTESSASVWTLAIGAADARRMAALHGRVALKHYEEVRRRATNVAHGTNYVALSDQPTASKSLQ